MLCTTNALRRPSAEAKVAILGCREKRANAGDNSCSAWPILFTAGASDSASCFSSRKQDIFDDEFRKYFASTLSFCSLVVKTETDSGGFFLNSSRIFAAAARSSWVSDAVLKFVKITLAFFPEKVSCCRAQRCRVIPREISISLAFFSRDRHAFFLD